MNAKKQARRTAAAKRFKIMSLGGWDASRFQHDMAADMGRRTTDRRRAAGINTLTPEYNAYVERKLVEKAALGL